MYCGDIGSDKAASHPEFLVYGEGSFAGGRCGSDRQGGPETCGTAG